MTRSDQYAPKIVRDVRGQVRNYAASAGRNGGMFRARPIALLVHRGDKPGQIRQTPVLRIGE